MDHEKKHSKAWILVLLAFGLLTVILITEIVRINSMSLSKINEDFNKILCADIKYQILNTEYQENNLILSITNDFYVNITKVTIISDNDQTYTQVIDPPLAEGESKVLIIPNVEINDSFGLYLNGCQEFVKQMRLV